MNELTKKLGFDYDVYQMNYSGEIFDKSLSVILWSSAKNLNVYYEYISYLEKKW